MARTMPEMLEPFRLNSSRSFYLNDPLRKWIENQYFTHRAQNRLLTAGCVTVTGVCFVGKWILKT
jgi:hypothetical protein